MLLNSIILCQNENTHKHWRLNVSWMLSTYWNKNARRDRFCLQSRAMWPAPPHMWHRILLVTIASDSRRSRKRLQHYNTICVLIKCMHHAVSHKDRIWGVGSCWGRCSAKTKGRHKKSVLRCFLQEVNLGLLQISKYMSFDIDYWRWCNWSLNCLRQWKLKALKASVWLHVTQDKNNYHSKHN